MSDKTHKIQIDIWNKYKNETKESLLEIISNQDKEIKRLNKKLEFERQIKKEDNPDNFATDVNVGGYRFFFEDFC